MSLLFEVKSRGYNLIEIFFLLIIRIKKIFKIDFKTTSYSKNQSIDIIIPTIDKDYILLQLNIESIRINLRNNIGNIFIISKSNEELLLFCKRNDINFIDENKVLGYNKDKIKYNVNGLDRSGWIFQQLLKLAGDQISVSDDYLVIDSDTILLNEHNFKQNDKYVLFQSTEWHKPYFKTYRKIFGYKIKSRLSFVSHMMIFNKKILKRMKEEIEIKNNKKWDESIISLINQNELSCFSEYETYGNYLLRYYRNKLIIKPFYNIGEEIIKIDSLSNLIRKYSDKYNSISFHNFQK